MAALASGQVLGKRAPGFALLDAETQKIHDILDYRGRVVVLEFMQAACPHCAKFTNLLDQAQTKYGNRVAILSIANPPSNHQAVAEFVKANKVKTPILFDCGQVLYSYVAPKTGSILVPQVFLIDAQGIVRREFGYTEETRAIFEGKGLFAEIDAVLAGKVRVPAAPKK
ncbi:MAG: peroxiredoxin family protein [Bryobacteraceae bacterium]